MVQQGRVKKWDPKGYGFIAPDRGDADVFFHISGLAIVDLPNALAFVAKVDEPRAGDAVEYELSQARDGRVRAINVKRIS